MVEKNNYGQWSMAEIVAKLAATRDAESDSARIAVSVLIHSGNHKK